MRDSLVTRGNRQPAAQPAAALVVSAGELARARWRHRLDRSGRARTTLWLPGRPEPIADDDLAWVWFRAREPLAPAWSSPEREQDTSYAISELTALVTSWLAALGGRAVNRPDGIEPSGPGWSLARWRRVARGRGLDRGPRSQRLLVAGPEVLGAASAEVAASAREVAAAGGCRLLGLHYDGRGRLCRATPTPELTSPAERGAAAALLTAIETEGDLR